jgi:transposase-like protein
MKKESMRRASESRVHWEQLEEWVRGQVQELIQELLEQEVTEFLGRSRCARRSPLDSAAGYRNGYGKPRKLTLGAGTVKVCRPRVRNVEERFESRVLPLFVRRSSKVRDLIPELYLHGLAEGDFDLALRGLLGDGAPVSASTVARLKEWWHGEYEAWRQRSLEELEVVYLWVDGVYVKAGLEKEKAAVLVAMAGLTDGRKVVVAIEPGYRESSDSWSALLRDLKARGMSWPCLVVGDGHLGIWGALRNVFPEADEQRCWNHKVLNVLDRLPKRAHNQARPLLCSIPYAATREEAEDRRDAFVRWCQKRGYETAAETLVRDWDRMVTFYTYPQAHWPHIRTTNPLESPFAALRLRTDAAKRYKRVERATALIWKLMMVAESRFRRLRGRELLPLVYQRRFPVQTVEEQQVLEEVAV